MPYSGTRLNNAHSRGFSRAELLFLQSEFEEFQHEAVNFGTPPSEGVETLLRNWDMEFVTIPEMIVSRSIIALC